ncbi:hypothetical protein PENTCL1PPCAC_1551, partial [Pristionchus entomophagus]
RTLILHAPSTENGPSLHRLLVSTMFLLASTFLFSTLLSVVHAEERLVFAQTLWRHGLRIPTSTYASDPYQESFWGVPWGELVTRGMEQHFEQGQRLRRRYTEETGLLPTKYSRYDTYVRSADMSRCIESAMSNMAAFYSDSPTFPSDKNGWPSGWTPVPVHTVPHDEDRELEAGVKCPRVDQLKKAREKLPVFQDFLASKWALFATINANAGEDFDVSMKTIYHFVDILKVERDDFNLTMPDWVTDEFYYNLTRAYYEGYDFTEGAAGFGVPEDTEILRLRGGFMLKEFIDNMNDVVNNATTNTYAAYSGHDSIVRALLLSLHVKDVTVGPGNPDYASTISCELWMRNQEYYVKMLYAPNFESDLIDFTSFLPMKCVDGFCALSDFLNYTALYIPNGAEDCNKQ